MKRACVFGGCLIICGCGPRKQASTITPAPLAATAKPAADGPPLEAFVTGAGHAETEPEAYVAAVEDLERQLTGAIGWTAVLGLTIHNADRDPIATSRDGEGVHVRVGLTQSRASALLAECELSRPQTHAPEAWTSAIDAVVLARTAAMVCARRDALFGVACDPPDTKEATADFDALGEGVAMTAIFPEGVPVDPTGAPLRSGGVFVSWHGNPVSGVPLRTTAIDGQSLPMLVTDRRGRAELPMELADRWKGGVKFDLDFHHMVGPLDLSWSGKTLEVRPRPVSSGRWALVIEADTAEAAAIDVTLRGQLEPHLGTPVHLAKKETQAIATSDATNRAPRLRKLADSSRGAIDFVLVTSVETRFANRAGGGRVWYEASGTVTVHDVWSGTSMTTVNETVTANGVGHERAEAQARRALAKALVAKIAKAFGSVAKPEAAVSRSSAVRP